MDYKILDEKTIKWAHRLYWNKDFLKLAKINELEQIEQDRIFNELIIAGLLTCVFILEIQGDPDAESDMNRAHREYLRSIGIEKEHLDLWKKLLKMRYEEYTTSKNNARMAMIEYERKESPDGKINLDGINFTLPPFNISVGAHKHIVRGKTKGRDILFKLIMKYLSRFYSQIYFEASGHKISIEAKVNIKLRHLINDIKDKINSKSQNN